MGCPSSEQRLSAGTFGGDAVYSSKTQHFVKA